MWFEGLIEGLLAGIFIWRDERISKHGPEYIAVPFLKELPDYEPKYPYNHSCVHRFSIHQTGKAICWTSLECAVTVQTQHLNDKPEILLDSLHFSIY